MPAARPPEIDSLIVGGGPAGLSAALVLARANRSVVVIDHGRPRNAASLAMHNFLTRDGIKPSDVLDLARREVLAHGVQIIRARVTAATCYPLGFIVRTDARRTLRSRTLLLATGVVDELPALTNLPAFYGKGVHHCPYCDAWHYRDKPLAACGDGDSGLGLAMNLLTWSRNLTVLTDGHTLLRSSRRKAAALGIAVRTEPVDRLLSHRARPKPSAGDLLGLIRFRAGPDLPVAALFFNTDRSQRSKLPIRLGCKMDLNGGVIHDKRQRTGVSGLFLAGDASMDVQFVIVAAAEGAKAGLAMNHHMQEIDRARILKPALIRS